MPLMEFILFKLRISLKSFLGNLTARTSFPNLEMKVFYSIFFLELYKKGERK